MTKASSEQWEIQEYETLTGSRPFSAWLNTNDSAIRIRLSAYVARLAAGNISAVKAVGQGVSELRLDFGPGYRIYFGRVGNRIILLLAGGTKRKQQSDIQRAKQFLKDFEGREANANITSIQRNDS